MSALEHRKRWSAIGIAVVAAALFAGAVVAGHFDAAPTGLEAAVRDEPLVRVARIPAANGLGERGVFVQPTSAGFLCLWDAPDATSSARQGGCNPADDPLAGEELFVSLAYDGGPDVTGVRDARLIGIAANDVAQVSVVMSDDTRRTVTLRTVGVGGRSYRAFGYRLRRADLEQGLGPTAVLALDARGVEIDRQATGFGAG